MNNVQVFSGGGAKGLLQVACLAAMEESGFDFRDAVLCAGASVGGINATILSLKDWTPAKLFEKYPGMVDQIFMHHLWPLVPIYDRKNFINCWSTILPVSKKFKDCMVPTLVTSVDAMTDITHFFKSWEYADGEEIALSVVMRSFAAPVYFNQLVDQSAQKVWYDGGCGAYNLPIDFAWEEILPRVMTGEKFSIYAFGTGYSNDTISFKNAANDGFLKQFGRFTELGRGGMSRVQSRLDQVRKMIRRAVKIPSVSFYYYDIEIPKSLDKMDDIKDKQAYIDLGRKMAKAPLIKVENGIISSSCDMVKEGLS